MKRKFNPLKIPLYYFLLTLFLLSPFFGLDVFLPSTQDHNVIPGNSSYSGMGDTVVKTTGLAHNSAQTVRVQKVSTLSSTMPLTATVSGLGNSGSGNGNVSQGDSFLFPAVQVNPLVSDDFESGSADAFWTTSTGTVDTSSKVDGANSLALAASGDRVTKSGLSLTFSRVKFSLLVDSASTAVNNKKVRWDIFKNGSDIIHFWISKDDTIFKIGVNTEAATAAELFTLTPDVVHDIEIDADTSDSSWVLRVDGTQVATGSHTITSPTVISDLLIGYEGFDSTDFTSFLDNVVVYDEKPGDDEVAAVPTRLNYGLGLVNEGLTKSVEITNTDDASITLQTTSFSGTDAAIFTESFDDVNGVVLAAGASTSFNVTFTPTSTGDKEAILELTHTGANTPLLIPLAGTGANDIPISFGKSVLSGTSLTNPTTLQFGPDGRLYVGQQDGLLSIFSIARNGVNNYSVILTETITDVQSIVNHDDDGTVNGSVNTRQVTGLLVAGTSTNPILYVSSSDPRIGAGDGGTGDLGLDTNSGIVTRLTWNGSAWDKVDLVRGLPRSEENHSVNGMQLDETNNILYLAVGGNTNEGAPSTNFALLPEYALSAAILKIDLDAIGDTTYDIPTLDDDTRAGTDDANDPFGGNDGKNQAKLVPGGPVQVYSPGWRNPYDLVITESGRMYSIDNGGNAGWGDVPVSEGPGGTCTNDQNEPGLTDKDQLHFITGEGFYAGHPNPTRGNMSNTFNSDNQSPVSSANAVECDYLDPDPGMEDGGLVLFSASTNGITEYTASNFQNKMKGDLLSAAHDNKIYRTELSADGTSADANTALVSSVGTLPLDVVAQGDSDPFPGTVWIADHQTNGIIILEPGDFGGASLPVCNGTDSGALDEDGDNYKNNDEIDAGTNPCSSADVPADQDGDFVSDINDPDDDNDGKIDSADIFALDSNDGMTTSIPISFTWDNDESALGGILNSGFTGLMHQDTFNYSFLFDPTKMTVGGAAGAFTVDEVTEGTANFGTQENGFQVGFKVDNTSPVFVVKTRILAPFAGVTPEDFQSMGIFVGDGTQTNYVKVVVEALAGDGGLELAKEEDNVFTRVARVPNTVPGPSFIDLFLTVNPQNATVQASYENNFGGNNGNRVNVGEVQQVPASWFDGTKAVAAGIISTSIDASFKHSATWDFFKVEVVDTESIAKIQVTPDQDIDASTFEGDSIRIDNLSTGNQKIEKVVIDLSTGILRDMVFDPTSGAGDTIAKDFTVNSGGSDTGFTTNTFSSAHDTGFDKLEINFNDFDPGERFGFSVDIDPTSIQGVTAPGPNESGSVSGLELTGATVTVTFDNAAEYTGYLFAQSNSVSGAQARIRANLPTAPGASIPGIATFPTTVSDASLPVKITGSHEDSIKILTVESGLFVTGVPGNGFDLDANETNSIINLSQSSASVDNNGSVFIPVNLTHTIPGEGQNMLVFTKRESDGATGAIKTLGPIQFTPKLAVTPDTGLSTSASEGNTVNNGSKTYTLTNNSGVQVSYSVTNAPNWITVTDNGSGSLAASGSTTVDVAINANVLALTPGTHMVNLSFNDLTHSQSYLREFILNISSGATNSSTVAAAFNVVSPYWQADSASYTFISVTHPSLSDMSSQIGVVMKALLNSGPAPSDTFLQPNGDGVLEFTVSHGSTQRIFIAGTNDPIFNPGVISEGLLVVNSPTSAHGSLRFAPKASFPNVILGSGEGMGYPDVSRLSIWGAIVVQSTSTGFAMEFIGDLNDSRATNNGNFSGVN